MACSSTGIHFLTSVDLLARPRQPPLRGAEVLLLLGVGDRVAALLREPPAVQLGPGDRDLLLVRRLTWVPPVRELVATRSQLRIWRISIRRRSVRVPAHPPRSSLSATLKSRIASTDRDVRAGPSAGPPACIAVPRLRAQRCWRYSSTRSALRSKNGTCWLVASTNRLITVRVCSNSSTNFSCSLSRQSAPGRRAGRGRRSSGRQVVVDLLEWTANRRSSSGLTMACGMGGPL